MYFDREPDWSPVDDRIVYRHRGPETFGTWDDYSGEDLFIVVPGGEPTRLTDGGSGVEDLSPAWSPDGDRVAFIRIDRIPTQGLPDQRDVGLWVIDADGTDARRVADASTFDDIAWTPDGTSILLSGGDAPRPGNSKTLRSVDVASGEVTAQGRSTGAMSWSPDGARLYAVTRTEAGDGYQLSVTTVEDGQIEIERREGTDGLFAHPDLSDFDVTTCPEPD
jgi:Tol biopolymer transport system component